MVLTHSDLEQESVPKLWNLYSWKNKFIRHQPVYDDTEGLNKVLKEIENAPKIVTVDDISDLKCQLTE